MSGKMSIFKGCIPCRRSELRLDITLVCGQSFRWKESKLNSKPASLPLGLDGYSVWRGVLAGYVWDLSQSDDQLRYEVYRSDNSHDCQSVKSNRSTIDTDSHTLYSSILKDYFRLDMSLGQLYGQWERADSRFKAVASSFDGVRMLRQDPVENLFSFICSSNNHISRISGMIERMCEHYGTEVVKLEGTSYYSFPTIEALAGPQVEETLRKLGFGYRAKYISQTAQNIHKKLGAEWLYNLRTVPYEEAKQELIQLHGVGAKVADCICLMSLDKLEAIPVDTHVWQIAARDYMPKLKTSKSLTDKLYREIGDTFRGIWGEYAGWAHSVLFSAELKQFKPSSTTTADRHHNSLNKNSEAASATASNKLQKSSNKRSQSALKRPSTSKRAVSSAKKRH